ncbi:hypothetical protein BPOR_0040g00120 [Botrytis porri]|uniref:Uncharacterized protein n=1 Tax=Botrytis porri TaxID=87229 RepID=A0A4Z1L2Q9_9HELO|nr:hypothetical protein BPOR_0040g00120 [Botrytis porri]
MSSVDQTCQVTPPQDISDENKNIAGSEKKNPTTISPGATCDEQPTECSKPSQNKGENPLKDPESREN